MVTIGDRLAEARRKSGLSIEDVAHKTHIHPSTIQHIEEDDFSSFPSVAYARSFISKYANFVGVDLSSEMQALNSGFTVRLGENELMDEMKQTIKKDRRFRLEKRPKSVRRKLEKPGGAPLLLNCILLALMGALGVFYFLGFHASSPEEAKSEIAKGLKKANPFSDEPAGEARLAATDSKPVSDRIEDSLNLPANPLRAEPIDTPPERASLKQVDLSREQETSGDSSAPPILDDPPATRPQPRPPGVEIAKPRVDWNIDTAKPKPLAKPESSPGNEVPAVRKTPDMKIEPDFTPPPIQSADLPAVRKVLDEPAAILRPAGTDPARREEPAQPKPGERTTPPDQEAPAIRATPVAGTQ